MEYIVYEAKGGIPGALKGFWFGPYFVPAAGKDAGLSKKISQNMDLSHSSGNNEVNGGFI